MLLLVSDVRFKTSDVRIKRRKLHPSFVSYYRVALNVNGNSAVSNVCFPPSKVKNFDVNFFHSLKNQANLSVKQIFLLDDDGDGGDDIVIMRRRDQNHIEVC